MATYQRMMIKRELRDAVDKLDIKQCMYLATLLGISKNKICTMAGINSSNLYKYLKTNKGLSINKQRIILSTIEEILL